MKLNRKNKLRYYRKKENLTQEELADILDITRDYVSIIERGVQTPGLLLAKKIADLFCTTIDDIFFSITSNETFVNDKDEQTA